MKNEHQQQVAMATEVGKLLPETKEKVEYYKEIIKAEAELIDSYEKRQSKWWISSVNKAKEKSEIIKLRNSIIQKKKVFESYLKRKNQYEKWLDEMAIEVNDKFDNVIAIAKEIPFSSNPRLHDGIAKWEELSEQNSLQDKVEMYLFMKNEIKNYEKFNKKRLFVD
jgi:hypothetical protein